MLVQCPRSCNLCGDLVKEKDRIQVTTKKSALKRPVFSENGRFSFIYVSVTDRVGLNNNLRPSQSSTIASQNINTPSTYDYYSNAYYNRYSSSSSTPSPYSRHQHAHHSTTSTSTVVSSTNMEKSGESGDEKECKDLVDYCNDLAERGDCASNEESMRYYCPKSCRFC
jgi:hypothetical protein